MEKTIILDFFQNLFGFGTGVLKRLPALMLVMCCTGFIWAAEGDPAEGFWLSVDDKTGEIQSGWHIYQENGLLYGKMLSAINCTASDKAIKCRSSYEDFPIAADVKQLPVLGSPWIFGLRQVSPGAWTGGHIINPDDGKIYKCKLTYRSPDGKKYQTECLEMRGEIGLGLGRSQYWLRVTREQAGALR
jgi:uncharacterized protein (DUF2147 family)